MDAYSNALKASITANLQKSIEGLNDKQLEEMQGAFITILRHTSIALETIVRDPVKRKSEDLIDHYVWGMLAGHLESVGTISDIISEVVKARHPQDRS